MFRSVAAAASLAIVAGCGHGGNGAAHVADPQSAVLRASDMPRGYQEGDDTFCGGAPTTEGNQPSLDRLFRQEQPQACVIELERVWNTAGPPRGVTSAAYAFHDDGAARRGFRARDDLAVYTADLDVRRTTDVVLGDEAKFLTGRGLNAPAAAVIWRAGNVVAMLAVEPADEHAATVLAARQQRRIEGKAPRRPPTDTVELQLDDPTLKLPVYWLGRVFHPGAGLPRLTLQEAVVLGTGPGDAVKLDYTGVASNRPVTLTLDVWEPSRWQRFRRTLLGRLVWDSPCARKTVVQLSAGHAEIFAGYGTPRPPKRPCPGRPPDRVLAQVYVDGVVVAVDMPYCYMCAAGPPVRSPYETVAGMTRVARGLELRRR